MEVTPLKRTSASEQIFRQLKNKILSGELRPGDKLPSENELCSLYGVSRTTVRQALANLSSLDLIETRFGEGSFIKEADSSAAMASALTHTFLSEKSIAEIVEFRQLMEPNVAKLACQKAEEDDVARLREIYQKMVADQDDLTLFAKHDCEFHIQIAKICRNSYIITLYEIITDILLNAFSNIVSKRGNEAGLKYHKRIIEAFAARDTEAAGALMQEHMDDLRQDYCQ